MAINKDFKIVYQAKAPKTKSLGACVAKRLRIAVGAGSIQKYIGLENAIYALQCAIVCNSDKVSCHFRKRGTVVFYRK